MIPVLCVLDPGSANQKSSSAGNIGDIVGVVAAVVVLVIVVSAATFCFYRRKQKEKNTENIPKIQNVAFEADAEAGKEVSTKPTGKPSDASNSDGLYEEPDNAKKDPIDANYQSFITENYEQLHGDPYEDVKAYASLNKDSNPRNEICSESLYEDFS